tara:strand:+ start:296 stop:802 length:507 start_codon:yes stop_codon:yes gene_type:complete
MAFSADAMGSLARTQGTGSLDDEKAHRSEDFLRFELKRTFAQTALHCSNEWRTGIFNQIDQILDEDAWDVDDVVPSESGWRTAIRLLIYQKFNRRPGLSFSQGLPVLAWVNQDIRVTIECHPKDILHWVASRDRFGIREVCAGEVHIRGLAPHIFAFNDDSWLVNGGH